MEQQDIDKLQKKALEQFKWGEFLFGKDGAFAPMLKSFIEAALQAEMDAHLNSVKSHLKSIHSTNYISANRNSFEMIQLPH